MSNLQATVVKFEEALQVVAGKTKVNRAYAQIRTEARDILDRFKADPLESGLIQEASDVVRRLENLNDQKLSRSNYLRSRSNIVYISALAKRTHYAAYMAGVWSNDSSISLPFKAWMHNSAAHGAISLYEAALPFTKGKNNKAGRQLLGIFAEGAIHDAERFLNIADKHFPECIITTYNRAKVDIYYEDGEKIRGAVKRLKALHAPTEQAEAPELLWHKDNYESFLGDSLMTEIIHKEAPEDLPRIEQTLKNNYDQAITEIERRGDGLWVNYHPYAKAALVGATTGALAIVYAVLGDASLVDLIGIASAHADVTDAAMSVQQIPMGGGGLASLDFSRAMGFGGGGLA